MDEFCYTVLKQLVWTFLLGKEFMIQHLSAQEQNNLNPAAVLIPFLEHKGVLSLLLTKRSQHVQTHKGQICFPGGRYERHDDDLWQTALRETQEEIAVPSHQIYYIGEMPEIITPTRYRIKPYIGFLHGRLELQPDPAEVESVLTVPLCDFCDHQNFRMEEREYFGKKYKVPFYSVANEEVWGATGRMIHHLLENW